MTVMFYESTVWNARQRVGFFLLSFSLLLSLSLYLFRSLRTGIKECGWDIYLLEADHTNTHSTTQPAPARLKEGGPIPSLTTYTFFLSLSLVLYSLCTQFRRICEEKRDHSHSLCPSTDHSHTLFLNNIFQSVQKNSIRFYSSWKIIDEYVSV